MSNTHPQVIGNDGIDLVAICLVAWRARVLVLSVTVACVLVAIFLAMTARPVFRAEVVVTEVSDAGGAASLAGQLGGLASLAGVNLGAMSGPSREAPAILKSRMLVEEFMRRGDILSAMYKDSDPNRTLWHGVNKFRESVLAIQEDPRTGLTTIAIDWHEPETAARWANDFVGLANEVVRTRAIADAELNISYLTKQIEATNVVELQRVMYNLIEAETKTLMLANAREQYAFVIVDPAVVPEMRISPRRTLMVILGGILGGLLGVMLAFAVHAIRSVRAA